MPLRILKFRLLLVGALAFTVGLVPASATADANAASSPARRQGWLSSAYERMLRDQIAEGRVLDAATMRRFGLDLIDDAGPGFEMAPWDALRAPGPRLHGAPNLGLDSQVNDKTGDATCSSGCANRPLGQAETTIAADGPNLLAGWNDTKGFCTGGAVQGYGYSTDGGATWTDGGDVPALPGGGRYRGDPVHAVNRATGDFYICGLYEGGALGSGLAIARGHFAAGSFVIDDNRQIAVGGADFLDKEWLAVDPLSGNIYVSYTTFPSGPGARIQFIRSQDNGLTWDPPIDINAPAQNDNVQGSRPVVGPDGELYVAWYEFGVPLSHHRIRRSNDSGASFGPEQTVCDFYENGFSGAPGYRRGFAPTLPSIAVDTSNGPHRGRVYVGWDEGLHFSDAPYPAAAAVSENEVNGFFASATPFAIGDTLRGAFESTADVDLYRFTGLGGQTVYFNSDSAAAATAMNLRLVCAADTAGIGTYRFLAFTTQGQLYFTLPASGTYYLRLNTATSTLGGHRILTTFDTPSGERSTDHRDQFVAWSDDGAAWSSPRRVVGSGPGFDGEFPEVTVDGVGRVHVYWHDWRDDAACGAESFEYIASSGDGGVTWGEDRALSDVSSFWSFNACGSANQGDYQGIASDGESVYPCWADSRLGDPDVFMEPLRIAHATTCATADTIAAAGSSVSFTYSFENLGNIEGDYSWTVTETAGWLTGVAPGPSGGVGLAPGGTQAVQVSLAVPAICSPEADTLRFVLEDSRVAGRFDTCITVVHCVSATDVPHASGRTLEFGPPQPNPSAGSIRFSFTLAEAGAVKLDLFAATGARVRRLVSGRRDAGDHTIAWDARDGRGDLARAGVYYAVLDVGGQKLRRTVVVLE